jgi:hypothetical protein
LLYWYKSTSTDAERELFAANKKKRLLCASRSRCSSKAR